MCSGHVVEAAQVQGLLPYTLTLGSGVEELTTGGQYALVVREQAERHSVGLPSGLAGIPASPRD